MYFKIVVVRKENFVKKEFDILSRLISIETTTEEIYKEIIKIRKELDEKKLDQMLVVTRLENIADFLKDRYDIVIEEKEKFNN